MLPKCRYNLDQPLLLTIGRRPIRRLAVTALAAAGGGSDRLMVLPVADADGGSDRLIVPVAGADGRRLVVRAPTLLLPASVEFMIVVDLATSLVAATGAIVVRSRSQYCLRCLRIILPHELRGTSLIK